MMRNAFLRALRSQNLWAPLLGGLMFVGSLCALELGLRAQWQCCFSPVSFRIDPKDDFSYVMCRIYKLRNEPLRLPAYYLLGGSSMRDALPWEPIVESRYANGFRLVNLATRSQTLAESLALVENLPEASGTLLLGLSPRRMNHSAEESRRYHKVSRTLVYSSSANDLLESNAWLLTGFFNRTKVYAWENRNVIIRYQIPKHPFVLPPRFSSWKALSPERWKRVVEKQVANYTQDIEQNFEFNLRILERLIEVAKKRRLHLVLLDLPKSPEVTERLEASYKKYDKLMGQVSEKYQLQFDKSARHVEFSAADFYDVHHLFESGRAKYMNALSGLFGRWYGV